MQLFLKNYHFFLYREPKRNFTDRQAGKLIFSEVKKVINKQLPNLFHLFEQLPDLRMRSEYSMTEICSGALAMNLLKCGSRNSYNNLRGSSFFCKYKSFFTIIQLE